MCRNKIFAQIFLEIIMKKSKIKINAQNSQKKKCGIVENRQKMKIWKKHIDENYRRVYSECK